jgi:hypothetical protein
MPATAETLPSAPSHRINQALPTANQEGATAEGSGQNPANCMVEGEQEEPGCRLAVRRRQASMCPAARDLSHRGPVACIRSED